MLVFRASIRGPWCRQETAGKQDGHFWLPLVAHRAPLLERGRSVPGCYRIIVKSRTEMQPFFGILARFADYSASGRRKRAGRFDAGGRVS